MICQPETIFNLAETSGAKGGLFYPYPVKDSGKAGIGVGVVAASGVGLVKAAGVDVVDFPVVATFGMGVKNEVAHFLNILLFCCYWSVESF